MSRNHNTEVLSIPSANRAISLREFSSRSRRSAAHLGSISGRAVARADDRGVIEHGVAVRGRPGRSAAPEGGGGTAPVSALDSTTQTQEARIRDLEERLGSALAEVESVRQGLPLDGEQIVKEARRRFLHFIVDRVNPGYQERHRGDLSSWNQELWKEAGQLGLIGFNAPAEIGGEGRDTGSWNITLEELGKLTEDPGFLIIIVVNKIWANLIHSQGNARLVERFARPMISGDLSLAWAVWEPADLSFMQSVARKVDSGWILSADKPMLTGGQYAGVFAVAVRDEATSEPILFLVERTDPGVKCTPLPTVGGHHIGYASLKLKDTFVPEDRLLLATDAISAVSPRFDFGALDALAVHLGWMQRTVSLCVSSLRSKVRAGMTVLSIPHVQAEL